jgi:hypothetical protein
MMFPFLPLLRRPGFPRHTPRFPQVGPEEPSILTDFGTRSQSKAKCDVLTSASSNLVPGGVQDF